MEPPIATDSNVPVWVKRSIRRGIARAFRPGVALRFRERIDSPVVGPAGALWFEFSDAREVIASEAGGAGSLFGMRRIEIACVLPRGRAYMQKLKEKLTQRSTCPPSFDTHIRRTPRLLIGIRLHGMSSVGGPSAGFRTIVRQGIVPRNGPDGLDRARHRRPAPSRFREAKRVREEDRTVSHTGQCRSPSRESALKISTPGHGASGPESSPAWNEADPERLQFPPGGTGTTKDSSSPSRRRLSPRLLRY